MVDKNLALEFVRVTEAAAVEAAKWAGKGESNAADHAAVTAMRDRLAAIDIDGRVREGRGANAFYRRESR